MSLTGKTLRGLLNSRCARKRVHMDFANLRNPGWLFLKLDLVPGVPNQTHSERYPN